MGDAAAAILNPILLARKPRVTDRRNGTTATAESQDGYTMAVSFWVAHPPQLSLFSIHATDKHARRCYFSDLPRVVGADGPFVLLRATFDGSVTREYFLYKAAAGSSARPRRSWCVHGGGGHYLLAALRDAPSSDDDGGYQLRIYSSEAKSWSTRTVQNPCPGVDRVIPDKVITLGGQDQGLLGWVDLSHGILVCNLLLLLQHQDDHDPPAGPYALFSICHNSTSGMRPLGIHCGPIKTICHRSNASTSQMDPVALSMHRWPLITTTSHCGHHQNISRLLALSLDLMRHPSHATTVTLEPATMGIHNNFLPLTYLPMAHTQAMTTINSSLPLL